MDTYLTIMVTVLVLTQIVRVTQNAISLHLNNKKLDKDLQWIKDNDVSKQDFETQREVMRMLHEKLRSEYGYEARKGNSRDDSPSECCRDCREYKAFDGFSNCESIEKYGYCVKAMEEEREW